MNIMRTIRFFILAALCLNSLNTLANEYRPRHSVPQYNKAHSQGFFAFSPLMFIGKFADGLSHIHMPQFYMPQFGKMFENIDLSCGSQIIQEHKVMLSAAGAVIVLSLLVKRLQKSEMCGEWLGEKYTQVSQSVRDYAKPRIKQKCPKLVWLSIKIAMQFFCDVIKSYIAMNQGTIVYSATAPVAGKLLDNVIGCPIPLLSWTSVGWITSGVVITKAYFDASFEKVNEKLDGIENKMGENQSKIVFDIQEVKEEVGTLSGWLGSLDQKSDIVIRFVRQYGRKLSNIASSVANLEIMGQNNTQQLQHLRQELGLVKQAMATLLAENTSLKESLGAIEKKIDGGFTRIESKLDNNSTGVSSVMFIENNSDSFSTAPFIASSNMPKLSRKKSSNVDREVKKLLLLQNNS